MTRRSDCVRWSDSERQYVLICPDDLCNSGSPICGLERGIDFEEAEWDTGYSYDDWDGEGAAVLGRIINTDRGSNPSD